MQIDIRLLTAADAAQLVRCFERCYGETYPNESFYDAQIISDRVARGALKSVVAVAGDGTVVGHTGLTVRDPAASVTEAGNTVVDPQWRGEGILARMGSALADLCRQSGFVGYVHYPTTAHTVMQKRSVGNGGTETGVMLGYVPAETDYRQFDRRPGRIAATIVYQPFAPAPPLRIYVPDRYAMLLGRLYGQLGLRRERLSSTALLSPTSVAARTHLQRRGLTHIHVEQVGADLGTVVRQMLDANDGEVAHVDLPLDEPGVDRAVSELAQLGFTYCGLLPGFGRSDVLRLQRLRDQPPAVFDPELANPDARSLLAFINAERAQPGA